MQITLQRSNPATLPAEHAFFSLLENYASVRPPLPNTRRYTLTLTLVTPCGQRDERVTVTDTDWPRMSALIRQGRAVMGQALNEGLSASRYEFGYFWAGERVRLELTLFGGTVEPGADALAEGWRNMRLSHLLHVLSARAEQRRGELSRDGAIVLRQNCRSWPNPERRRALQAKFDEITAHVERVHGNPNADAQYYGKAQARIRDHVAELLTRARY